MFLPFFSAYMSLSPVKQLVMFIFMSWHQNIFSWFCQKIFSIMNHDILLKVKAKDWAIYSRKFWKLTSVSAWQTNKMKIFLLLAAFLLLLNTFTVEACYRGCPIIFCGVRSGRIGQPKNSSTGQVWGVQPDSDIASPSLPS